MGVPVNSLASPRFCGVRTFQRLPHSADCSGQLFGYSFLTGFCKNHIMIMNEVEK